MKHGDLNALYCAAAFLVEKKCVSYVLGLDQSYYGINTLTPVEGNIDSGKYIEVLDQHLWPVIAKEFPNGGWTFQDDNCLVHVSRQTVPGKTENNIETLPWPSQSPDIYIYNMKMYGEQSKFSLKKDLVRFNLRRI